MSRIQLFITICLAATLKTSGQDSLTILKKFNYRYADSIAINFPKKKHNSFTEIAYPLCEKINSEHEKFRAIFRWITENIEYNKTAATIAEADKIVRKNKAVCQGFANLLREMCISVGIECDTITGFTKTDIKDIGKKLKKTDHAWNAVKLYGRWYLVDVTWATSKYNLVTHKFEKNFDDHYFLCPPESFILDHFPKNKKWQLLSEYFSPKSFSRLPLYYADYFHLKITDLNPNKGSIRIKHGKKINLSISTPSVLTEISYQFNNERFATPLEWEAGNTGHGFLVAIPAEKKGKFTLSIYVNRQIVTEYIVKVR